MLTEHLPDAGRFEGVFEVLDGRLAFPIWPSHGNDVKASGVFQKIMPTEIAEGSAGQPALLVRVDGFDRMTGGVMTAGLDFDENNGAAIDGDKVDLTNTIALATSDNDVAEPLQETTGSCFTTCTERLRPSQRLPPLLELPLDRHRQ